MKLKQNSNSIYEHVECLCKNIKNVLSVYARKELWPKLFLPWSNQHEHLCGLFKNVFLVESRKYCLSMQELIGGLCKIARTDWQSMQERLLRNR